MDQTMGLGQTFFGLFLAFVLGTFIGVERQWRQHPAGLRTNTLVALGAAIFVDLGLRMGGRVNDIRVVSYVVSGVGFLGAGAIMKEGINIRGINTAATLWCSAAVGACSGAQQWMPAVMATFFILLTNTFLRTIVGTINNLPMVTANDFIISVCAGVEVDKEDRVFNVMRKLLRQLGYPVRNMRIESTKEGESKIIFNILSGDINEEDLKDLLERLKHTSYVKYVNWSQGAKDH
ncbi:MgtC/SapB transporter [Thermodesulfobium narugense DSM 14796]|uniref:MgtC/SapB transporter n=1 Tax=Thermodesulfobium narugense DSM 14796 TaxID=747365 RepID=M1E6P2_9BACT|nr:MgtC/SapB family protein [Thermodesulfobium narugense]AEE14896.1 MgtC/SapB transporter [Thermodesulfobium narugense DSM 14796]